MCELVTYQRSLKGVEEASFSRVGESRLFKDISREEWYALAGRAVRAGEVQVRKGFQEFVDEIESKGGKGNGRWGIVSVNFCEDWVRGVLGNVLGKEKSESVNVFTNQPDKDGILRRNFDVAGGEGGVLCTSDGKLEAMKAMTQQLRSVKEQEVVYIGDSSTDVECLLDENVEGVIMVKEDGESKLADLLESIGEVELVERYKNMRIVRSVRNYDVEWTRRNGKRIWFARDFEDLLSSDISKARNS